MEQGGHLTLMETVMTGYSESLERKRNLNGLCNA